MSVNHGPTSLVPARRELHRIFREVEAETGIVLRGDFACCSSCGQAELGKPEVAPRGYAFYHAQDTDSAASEGVVYLCFHGSPEGSPPERARSQVQVGRDLVRALEARGLFVRWNRRTTSRITVAVDRDTFDLYLPEAQRMSGLATSSYQSVLDDGWASVVWEEPEATHPEARWCGLLLDPDTCGVAHAKGSTQGAVEQNLHAAYRDAREDWDGEPLLKGFPAGPVGDA